MAKQTQRIVLRGINATKINLSLKKAAVRAKVARVNARRKK